MSDADFDNEEYSYTPTIREELERMHADENLKTDGVYKRDEIRVGFIEKHATYLADHPKVNTQYYLANLRTMLKIRS